MEAARAACTPVAVLETVRCLECGEVYSKPVAGGTVQKNPGCPTCGYVGWMSIKGQEESPRRFVAGLRQLRVGRAR